MDEEDYECENGDIGILFRTSLPYERLRRSPGAEERQAEQGAGKKTRRTRYILPDALSGNPTAIQQTL